MIRLNYDDILVCLQANAPDAEFSSFLETNISFLLYYLLFYFALFIFVSLNLKFSDMQRQNKSMNFALCVIKNMIWIQVFHLIVIISDNGSNKPN